MSVSFGFKKKIESKVVNVEKPKNEEPDYLETVEGKVIKSTKLQKEPPRDLVIPLIKQNVYKIPTSVNKQKTSAENVISSIDAEAAKEILAESKTFLEDTDQNGEDFENLAVPLLMKNKVPEGYETDNKLDVSLRPDEASEAQYDQIPVAAFGMAVLRGMGWKPEVGIGRTFKQNTEMLHQQVRPKGLGLGADVATPIKADTTKTTNRDETHIEENQLALEKGANVFIHRGALRNKYGVILGLDIETARCIVKMAIGGKSEQIGQHCLRVVTKKEYDKNAKDLSRLSKAYTGDNMLIIGNGKNTEENDKRRESPGSDRAMSHQKDTDMKHKEKRKRRHKEYSPPKHKKSKKHKSNREISPKQDSNSTLSHWVQPQMRVRIVDKSYKKGRYYLEKVIIEDVLGGGLCCCKTTDGRLLDDIEESMLETVIPKSASDSYIIIVKSKFKSKHSGKLAKILEKDKANCEALVQLIEDRDVVVRVAFEEMCEYTGDVEASMMF
ncbi:G-patch domain and KOW motifs-containing protein-like [Styela clava]